MSSRNVHGYLTLQWTAKLCLYFFFTDVTKMTFEELSYKNPKLAIEKISEDYKIYCEKAPAKGKCLRLGVRQGLFSSKSKNFQTLET